MLKQSILAGAAVVLAPLAAHATTLGTTTADLHVRQGPGVNYPVVASIPNGASVVINGCLSKRDWCRVAYNGETGWSSSHYLDTAYAGTQVVVTNRKVHIPVITPVGEAVTGVVDAAAGTVGAVVYGAAHAVGAVTFGAAGAVRDVIPPYHFGSTSTVVATSYPTYSYAGPLRVGAVVPASWKLAPQPGARYAVVAVNDSQVLVDPATRTVVRVY